MKMQDFVNQAWADHGDFAEDVVERLPGAISHIAAPTDVLLLVPLITHLYGEHLDDWADGIKLLERLLSHPRNSPESLQAISRSVAALKLAQGEPMPASFSKSDVARVLSVAAAARMARGHLEIAVAWLRQASALVETLSSDDPAHRALAVTANNMAASLEEQPTRRPDEVEGMLLAARLALEAWAKAGGWSQIQIAHYRLARCLLKAGHSFEAIEHGQKCLRLCMENQAGVSDLFWAREILAAGELAAGDKMRFYGHYEILTDLFNQMNEVDQEHCAKALGALKAAVSIN